MDLIGLLLISAFSLIFISFIMKSLVFRPRNKKRMAPMAPGAWPLVGHLAIYNTEKPTHMTLGAMADVYGPVFMTKLGSYKVFVISSPQVAKECFTLHDKSTDRVDIIASKLMGYDSLLSFSPHGTYWREMRKIAVSKLFTTSTIDMLKYCRVGEANVTLGDLYRTWEGEGGPTRGVLVDMKREFQDLVTNTNFMMIAGKRYFGRSPNCDEGEARRCRKIIEEMFYYFGLYLLSDVVPTLGWLEWRINREMKKTGKELDNIIEAWVEEHKNKRNNKNCGTGNEKDYLGLLIDIFQGHDITGVSDAHTTTKALCLNLILTGSEIAIVVVVWAVSLLVNNPHVLRKAQEELDRKIGKDRVVEESDLNDLVYLQAIVKETFRLYPPAPLNGYRDVKKDFDIANGNYHVPAGTQLLVNVWKLQRDTNVWSNPEEFDPERFLTTHKKVDVGGKSFKLLPFGMGRRICPAIPLGVRMVHYVLARFLQSFDLARPSNQEVDMTEGNGFASLKTTPLEVLIYPRLHKSLYDVVHRTSK